MDEGRRARRTAWALGLFALFIVASSSTVVPFRTFVLAIQDLSPSQQFDAWFPGFWLAAWFVVVKGWHFTEYAIIVVLAHRLLHRRTRRAILIAFVLAVLFAITDEYHQSFVPDRDGTVLDVGIDALGAAVAAGVLWWRRTRSAARPTVDPPAA